MCLYLCINTYIPGREKPSSFEEAGNSILANLWEEKSLASAEEIRQCTIIMGWVRVGMRVGQRKWSEQRNEGGAEGVGHLFPPTAAIV